MSYMIKGRTYRNIPTTNEQKPTGPVEPQKLKIITTAIIPEKTKPDAEPMGTDLSKMITTHDERDVEDMSKGESIPLDEPEPKKKAGRPKKAE